MIQRRVYFMVPYYFSEATNYRYQNMDKCTRVQNRVSGFRCTNRNNKHNSFRVEIGTLIIASTVVSDYWKVKPLFQLS